MNTKFTNVEKSFFEKSKLNQPKTKIPYIQVDNIPDLGLLTSLRFLEWIIENPEGVISLPTGKTPEYFIKWTQYILSNWGKNEVEKICTENGLDGPFCDLTQKIWVEQHRTMELILGKDFWYQNEDPHFRATHGLVFLKELTVEDFLNTSRTLEESIEGSLVK